MGTLPLLALQVVVLTGSVRGNYEVRARVEARARSLLPGDLSTSSGSADLEIQPAALMGLDGGDVQGYLTYMPRLLVREPQIQARNALLHRAQFLIEKGAERRFHTYFSQYGAYGDTEFSLLSAPGFAGLGGTGPGTPTTPTAGGPTASPVQTVPLLNFVRYVESNSTVGLDARFTERFTLFSALSYLVSGGANEEARQGLPYQSGPAARFMGDYRLTTRDVLRTDLQGAHANFSAGQRASVATLTEEWQRRLTPYTRMELGAGVGATALRLNATAPTETVVYPVASASLTREVTAPAYTLEGTLSALLSPTIDRFNAQTIQRAELGASGQINLTEGFWARASGSVGQTVGAPSTGFQQTAFLAEGTLGHPLFAGFAIDGGARAVWQRFGGPDSPTNLFWLSFVALSWMDDGHF